MNQKISVIIPVYNVEKYLSKCLDSVINQSYKNIEIIIVNDCSPDNSEQIILNYQQKDSRIKYIKNESNIGLFLTRKNGLIHSTGEYIVNIDSDDTFSSLTIFEDMMTYFKDESIDIVAFGWNILYELDIHQHLNTTKQLQEKSLLTTTEKLDEYYRGDSFSESMCKKIFRKSVLTKNYTNVKDKHLTFQEDGLMFMYIMCNSNIIQISSKVGYNYMQRPGSSTQIKNMNDDEIIKTLQDLIYVNSVTRKILEKNNLWNIYFKKQFHKIHELYNWMYKSMKETITPKAYEQYEYLFYDAFNPWVILNIELKKEIKCYNDKWYKFGQLSLKQKIKKIITVILKKIKLYNTIKLLHNKILEYTTKK